MIYTTIKQSLLLLMLLFLSFSVKARIYYSRTNGNWNNSSTWSTINYSSNSNSGTFPSVGDTVYIGDGNTVTINISISTHTIFIGDGSESGILEYGAGANYSFTVTSRMSINSNGIFYYNSNSASGRTHQFFIQGDLVNNGVMDLDFDTNDFVNVSHSGSMNSTVSGSGTFDLKNVSLSKSTVRYSVEVMALNYEPAIESFSAGTGQWVHSSSSIFDINPTSNFQINPGVVIECNSGEVRIASSSSMLTLQGALIVSGGTVKVGSPAGTGGIRTDQNGSSISSLIVSSGSLIVYGGITNKTGSGSLPFKFTMEGGTLYLHEGSTGMNLELLKVTDVAGSEFNMSGGTIFMQKPNLSGGASPDMNICGSNGKVEVSGGEVQFGNSSTPAGAVFNFRPYPNATYPGFVVDGSSFFGSTLCASNSSNDGDTMRVLYLRIEQGCMFDHRSFSGSVGNNKALVVTGDKMGTAFYNAGHYVPRSGRLVFAGAADQIIEVGEAADGGLAVLDFYQLEIRSLNSVILNSPVNIFNGLFLTGGLLVSTSDNYPTLFSGATTTVGVPESYVSGPMAYQMAASGSRSLNFPIGADGNWRPIVLNVNHSSSALVTYFGQLENSQASALPYSLPPSLSSVSDVRYYTFARIGASNLVNASLQIYYDGDDNVMDATTLRVAQVVGAEWVNQGGMGTADFTGTITSSTFNSFTSTYALGFSAGPPSSLPVSLLSFSSVKEEKSVLLHWKTASELNNDRFEILRSADGVFFESIGHVSGSGTTSQTNEYAFRDEDPFSGYNFYRLRQVDYDGTATESMTLSVNFLKEQITVYPSVSDGKNVCIQLPSTYTDSYIFVYSMDGKVILDQKVEPGQRVFQLPEISQGTYRALISVDGKDLIKPIVVVN